MTNLVVQVYNPTRCEIEIQKLKKLYNNLGNKMRSINFNVFSNHANYKPEIVYSLKKYNINFDLNVGAVKNTTSPSYEKMNHIFIILSTLHSLT